VVTLIIEFLAYIALVVLEVRFSNTLSMNSEYDMFVFLIIWFANNIGLVFITVSRNICPEALLILFSRKLKYFKSTSSWRSHLTFLN
jgi:hypothetical protein